MRSGKTLKSLSHFKEGTSRGLRPNNSTLVDEAFMKEHKFTIGKSRKCDIVLVDDTVSRHNAELIFLHNGHPAFD